MDWTNGGKLAENLIAPKVALQNKILLQTKISISLEASLPEKVHSSRPSHPCPKYRGGETGLTISQNLFVYR